MPEIVNLNKFRKTKNRRDKAAQAAENRVRYGRSKDEKALTSEKADFQSKELDGKRLEDDEA